MARKRSRSVRRTRQRRPGRRTRAEAEAAGQIAMFVGEFVDVQVKAGRTVQRCRRLRQEKSVQADRQLYGLLYLIESTAKQAAQCAREADEHAEAVEEMVLARAA